MSTVTAGQIKGISMSDGIWVATIAGLVAITVAYVNNFVAEGYRRFRDGSALAASLAGELGSYETAWPMLLEMLDSMISAVEAKQKDKLSFRMFERPTDLVFEDAVSKLGLLGAKAAENVVYVYSNIRAFRLALELIMKDGREMSEEEILRRCVSCKECLERALSRGPALRAGPGILNTLQSG